MNFFKYFLVMTFFVFSMDYCAQSIFLGTVMYPMSVENPDPLFLLYKGGEYRLVIDNDFKVSKKGMFEIYEEHDCSELYLLIGNIKLPQSTDFEFLETDSDYQFFKLVRKSKMRETVVTTSNATNPPITVEHIEYWDIQELPSHNEHGELIQRSLPKNTIILLTNPQLISTVESEEWKLNDIYFKLPKIVFRNSIDQKTFHDMSTRMLFAAVDLRCLHKKITKTSKSFAQNKILSVRDPLNCYVDKITRI